MATAAPVTAPADTPVAEVAAALIQDLYRWARCFTASWGTWTTWATGRLCFLALRMPHVIAYLNQHHRRPDHVSLAHFLAAAAADDLARAVRPARPEPEASILP